MDTESLLFAFAIGWGVWMLLKIHRRRGGGKGALINRRDPVRSGPLRSGPVRPGQVRSGRAEATLREMPRMGKPGTMTANQARALQRTNFEPNRQWSFEEAALILDSVIYLRAVCRDIADSDDGPPPLAVQNDLLRFILTEQDLRDYVRKWGETRRNDGSDEDDDPELPHNRQFERVAAAARGHLAP
jgi:hypothetical protein